MSKVLMTNLLIKIEIIETERTFTLIAALVL